MRAKIEYVHAARLLPAAWRRVDKFMSAEDRREEWGTGADDVGSFPIKDPPDTTADVGDPPSGFPDDLNLSSAEKNALGRALAKDLTPAWFAGRRAQGFAIEGKELFHDQALQNFYDGLPRVRRLLANVATYMSFDDHEVTDDWNITGEWVAQVNARPLGRAILRNGLLAFGLFQAWGNDPLYFQPPQGRPDTPGKAMLEQARRLFLDPAARPLASGPADEPVRALERLFNLGPGAAVPAAARVRWHFHVGGPGYEVLSLDTRTQRGYPKPAEPAELLTREALEAQVPADPVFSYGPPPEGAGVTFVIAPAPVLGFPPVEYIVQPAINALDRLDLSPAGSLAAAERDYFAGFYDHDPEPWTYQEHVFEALLERLSAYGRVAFLSGDVHYACCLKLDYWRYDPTQPAADPAHARFVQLTASAFKNQTSRERIMLFQSGFISQLTQLLGVPRERLGFKTEGKEPPLVPPPGGAFSRHVERQNHAKLALIPVAALPEGTKKRYPPSFAWRLDMVRDGRGDADRLKGVNNVPVLPADGTGSAFAHGVAVRHFWETVHAPSRIVTFLPSAGEVRLKVEDGGLRQCALRSATRCARRWRPRPTPSPATRSPCTPRRSPRRSFPTRLPRRDGRSRSGSGVPCEPWPVRGATGLETMP